MPSNKSLSIRELLPADARAVAGLLSAQSPQYLRFFYAFGSDESTLGEIFGNAQKDVYSGVFWQNELAGIFFLRGWDAGYEIPSFGVLIADRFRGLTFMRLTLDIAKLTCRLSGSKQLMAKIHPENMSPRGAGRLGFRQTGVEETTGNIVYHLEL